MSNFAGYSTTAMTVSYDPTGTASANLIPNEITTPITEPDIFFLQGPIFGASLVVTGVPTSGGSAAPLVPFIDFVFSPLYSGPSGTTGQDVYSFILLNNYTNWTSIHVTYQAVGGAPDTTLLNNIAAAGSFDRTNINLWLAIKGDSVHLNPAGPDLDLKQNGPVYLFANRLSQIAQNLSVPNALVAYITNAITTLQTNYNSMLITLGTKDVTGTIKPWPGSTANIPSGWLQIPIAATNLRQDLYPALYALIGTIWGPTSVNGGGYPTFAMPYLPTGQVFVNGSISGTFTNGVVINHTHPYYTFAATGGLGGGNPVDVGTASPQTGNPPTGGTANLPAGASSIYIIKT